MSLYAKIKSSSRFCRDVKVRRKINLFLHAVKSENIDEACSLFSVSRSYYYRWRNRFKKSNFDSSSLCEQNRKPLFSPNKIPIRIINKIGYYRKTFRYGPKRICYWLKLNHNIQVSEVTVYRIICRKKWFVKRYRTIKENPHRKRYSLPWPGQMLQLDIKYVPEKIRGKKYYSFNAIDDSTRWRFARIYPDKSLESCLDFTKDLVRFAPFKIQCIQTDNDVVFTNRYSVSAFNPEIHLFTETLKSQGIRHRLIPPGAKELNGKVERSHRIDDDEFFWKAPYGSFYEHKKAYAQWIWEYNNDRPHSSIAGKTPMEMLIEKTLLKLFIMAYYCGFNPEIWFTTPKPIVKITQWGAYLKYLDYLDYYYETVSDVLEFYICLIP